VLLAELFKQALDDDRPPFIDFFLRINYDPRTTFDLLDSNTSSTNTGKDGFAKRDADALNDITKSKSREAVLNYQNQVDLGKRGLDFVFQLYTEAFGSYAKVSFCSQNF
jgi:hypothetical protein